MDGTPFGRYLLLSELGRGGMGVVFRAWDPELSREVALKTLLAPEDRGTSPPGSTPPTVQRFLREARSAARLRHPNVIAVYDVGQHEGRYYFTMELVEGVGLDGWLKSKPTFLQIASVLEGTARGLSAAHAEGVVHRDVKPSNILVDARGRARLGDFGLAKDVETATTTNLTLSGALLGTPQFMPPEQTGGATETLDPRSDVYSLGAVAYFALTGRPPFEGPTLLSLLQEILTEDPVPPARLVPSIPRDLEVICLKALEKQPDRRYASAAAMADDLARFVRGEPIVARAPGLVDRAARVVRRRAAWVAAAAALAAITWGAVVAVHSAKGASAESARERQRREAQDLLAGAEVGRARDVASLTALLPVIRRAIDADPEFAAAWLASGRVRERLGDLEGARSDYRRARELDPSLAEAHYREGCMWLWTSSGDEWAKGAATAREAFQRAGAAQPGSAYASLGEAYILAFEREREEALARVARVLESAEPHADAWFLRGALRSYDFTRGALNFGKTDDELRDFETAEEDLTRGLELDPLSSWGLASRGAVRFATGNFDAARRDFVASLALSPDRAPVAYMASRVALALDLYDDCYRYSSQAIRLREDDKYYMIRALLGLHTCRYREALRDMDQAVRIKGDQPSNRIMRALLRALTGDLAGASADAAYVRALPEEETKSILGFDKDVQRNDAAVQVALKAFADFDRVFVLPPARKKALRDSQRAFSSLPWFRDGMAKLTADPTSSSELTSVLFGFGEFMETRPGFDKAFTFTMKGLGLRSQIFHPTGVRWLGRMVEEQTLLHRKRLFRGREYLKRAGAYYRHGQYEEALGDLVEAERLSPSDADVLYALATLRALRGDGDGAVSALKRARDAGWGHPEYTREDEDFESVRERGDFKRLLE